MVDETIGLGLALSSLQRADLEHHPRNRSCTLEKDELSFCGKSIDEVTKTHGLLKESQVFEMHV